MGGVSYNIGMTDGVVLHILWYDGWGGVSYNIL